MEIRLKNDKRNNLKEDAIELKGIKNEKKWK